MASVGGSVEDPWKWSEQYRNYYRFEYRNQQWITIWHDPSTPRYVPTRPQEESSAARAPSNYVHSPTQPASPSSHRQSHGSQSANQPTGQGGGDRQPGNMLSVNTDQGLRVGLYPDYVERTDPNSFFRLGRMFSLLFTEPYSERTANGRGRYSSITWVPYNERVYSQIRRFVAVENRRGFCYALPISTYGGRGTTKPGVEAGDHAIVYSSAYPRLLQGETGITKQPIRVIMARQDIWLDDASRLNFGIQIPIQHNVKVRDLGIVADEDQPNLYAYWQITQRPR